MKERLKEVAKALNKSFNEISIELGYSKGYLYQMVNGTRALKDRVIKAICNTYGVSENWLRTGSGKMFISSTNETDDERLRKHIRNLILSLPDNARQDTIEFMRRLYEDCKEDKTE